MAENNRAPTILVIEDEDTVRHFACRVFELEGYSVLQAENGEAGLRLVEENHVDLVLLDLQLPDLNGWAILERIRKLPDLSALPVIIFTASAGKSEHDKALTMGVTEYLVKPVSVTTLRNTVARILRENRNAT